MGWATGEPCVLFPRPVTCPHYSSFFSRDRIGGDRPAAAASGAEASRARGYQEAPAVRRGGEGCAAKGGEGEGPGHCRHNDADPPGCIAHGGTPRARPAGAQQGVAFVCHRHSNDLHVAANCCQNLVKKYKLTHSILYSILNSILDSNSIVYSILFSTFYSIEYPMFYSIFYSIIGAIFYSIFYFIFYYIFYSIFYSIFYFLFYSMFYSIFCSIFYSIFYSMF